jgi:ribonucleotide reductase alpha subunit
MEREEALQEIAKEKDYKKLLKHLNEEIDKFTTLVEYAQDDMDEEFFTEDLRKAKKEYKLTQEKLENIEILKKEYK